jgi:alpha-tubulin suppressor-like RCC1 family protein
MAGDQQQLRNNAHVFLPYFLLIISRLKILSILCLHPFLCNQAALGFFCSKKKVIPNPDRMNHQLQQNTNVATVYIKTKAKLRLTIQLLLFSLLSISTANAQCTYFVKIASGTESFHSLGIKNDGTLWAWGLNDLGQLGDGTTSNRWSPVQIGTATNWVAIAAGKGFSAGLQSDGTLWTWGNNNSGQLANGGPSSPKVPTRAGTASDWKAIACGRNHILLIKNTGTLWVCGDNYYGQLGDGTNTNRNTPAQSGTATNWVAVAGGNFHSLALNSDGKVYGWGVNSDGQLGDGTTANTTSPTLVNAPSTFVSISAGAYHSAGILADGSAWGWGANRNGELGTGDGSGTKNIPTQIGTATDWVSIVCAGVHTTGVRGDGTAWAWGGNQYNVLGHGDQNNRDVPTQIGAGTDWVAVATGIFHTIAIRNGTTWGWGGIRNGEPGDGTNNYVTSPKQTIAAPTITLATTNTSATKTQTGFTFYNNSCSDLIATVKQTGTINAISGATSASVWLETGQPAYYVKRHYEIAPVTNAGAATGRVTLYFTQQEFTDFNIVNNIKLPVDGTDADNYKANLLIEKISGASNDGTGWPGSYGGIATTINPADASIVWNNTDNRWEVTFETTGFGGFFLKTQSGSLVKVLNVAGLTSATPAAVAYSLRLLSTDYTGYAIRVRRSNDNNTQDIGFNIDGSLDTIALKYFVGVNNGYVAKWYDQSGNGLDAEQTTVTQQPLIVNAGIIERINRQPAVYFGTANLATAKKVIFTKAASMVGTAKGNSNAPSAFVTKTGTGAGANLNYPGPFDFTNSGGEFTVGSAATTIYSLINVANSTPPSVVNNGVSASVYSFVIPSSGTYYNYMNGVQAGSQTVNAFQDGGNSLMLGNRNDGGSSGNFRTPEIVMFNLVLSTVDRQTLEAAQQVYYFPSTLPINWLSVKGKVTAKNTAQITWRADEVYVKNYQVEKSVDGKTYTNIGLVQAAGNGSHDYSFTDARMATGATYYRIRQNDLDGAFTFSPIITLTSEATGHIAVYPNPANDIVTVTVPVNLLNTVATLYDANGNSIQSLTISSTSFTLKLQQHPTGIYFLKMAGGEMVRIIRN